MSRALERRRGLLSPGSPRAFRAYSGESEGIDGVFVDVYGEGAVLIAYEGRVPRAFDGIEASREALEALREIGVRAVYLKPFARDRSRLGGALPACVTDREPAAGEAPSEAILIHEGGGALRWTLEVRLWDGLSTGLFLDQRENRGFVARWVRDRVASGKPAAVLNTFAYTCAFSVAAAVGGASTTSVDVSGRYLDWGQRNFAHNALDVAAHRFARMDTLEFFGYAERKGLRYDLIVLDPPSFSAGSKRKGVPAWSSVSGFAGLVEGAARLLNEGGVVLASTNTQELCRPGRLEREIVKGLGGNEPRWIRLPAPPVDFASERERFAARAFAV